mmetsp:Transcript_17341/g.42144  ORF Transcript_17341/g.42144 Transcript_17341/m.42144 type:complete len:81 (+) Transcript_17341:1302-1544(+)
MLGRSLVALFFKGRRERKKRGQINSAIPETKSFIGRISWCIFLPSALFTRKDFRFVGQNNDKASNIMLLTIYCRRSNYER